MSSEGFPQNVLPNFEPLEVSELIASFTYERHKEAEARILPPEQEGAYRAAVVINCPISVEGWHEYGVITAAAENIYWSTILSTIANGARDSEVATAMLSKLTEATDTLSNRISPELAQMVLKRTLSMSTTDPDTAINTITWAFTFIPDQEMRSPAVAAALKGKSEDQLTPFFQLIQPDRPEHVPIHTALQAQYERVEIRAEELRELQEAARQRALKAEATEKRRMYIVRNAVQAFQEIISAAGIATVEDVATIALAGADELLFASHAVVVRDESPSTPLAGKHALLTAVAMEVLDRAVMLRRSDASFADRNLSLGHHLNYSLDKHENRKVIAATSIDDFWAKVADLAEHRELTPHHINSLYKGWRSRLESETGT